jgi:hypothetical protein
VVANKFVSQMGHGQNVLTSTQGVIHKQRNANVLMVKVIMNVTPWVQIVVLKAKPTLIQNVKMVSVLS